MENNRITLAGKEVLKTHGALSFSGDFNALQRYEDARTAA